jgi:endonuclease/exonuclease/phosphatase family metal-dependent hydrolase
MPLRLKNLFIAFAFVVSAIFFCILSRSFGDAQALPTTESVSVRVPEKEPGTLRIASMNCKNYLSTNRYTADGKFKRRWAKPLAERAAMWQVFDAIRPDVVALQEIGDQAHLDELAGDLARETGLAFPYRVCLDGRDSNRRIGIVSCVPFEKVFRFAEKERMSRGILGVEIRAGTERLRVFTVHLKSKLSRSDDDPECDAERLEEADCVGRKLAGFVDEFCVLLGDFNDFPESAPLLCVAQKSGMRRLELRDSCGEAWTYRYFKMNEKRTFDHFFISPKLVKFKVPQGEGIADEALSRKVLPDGTTVYASDHRMIFADFSFLE